MRCVIDTVIYYDNFSVCMEKDSSHVVIQYKDERQIVTWPRNVNLRKDVNGILFLNDTILYSRSSFFCDSTYFISVNDDLNQGILYVVKFTKNGTITICKNAGESYNYLLSKYGQFIIDTAQQKVLIANQSKNEEDSSEQYIFSVYDFSTDDLRYVNAVKGNTHYIYTRRQIASLRDSFIDEIITPAWR